MPYIQIGGRLSLGGVVPVTAKLSRKFYETFGDEITNELVEWFNAVDTTYQSQLRELNELNFARFDARQEQRMAELETKLIRWMFAFWAPTALAVVALLLSVLGLLLRR